MSERERERERSGIYDTIMRSSLHKYTNFAFCFSMPNKPQISQYLRITLKKKTHPFTWLQRNRLVITWTLFSLKTSLRMRTTNEKNFKNKNKKKTAIKVFLGHRFFTSLPKDNTPDSQLVTKRKQLQHYVLLYSTQNYKRIKCTKSIQLKFEMLKLE